MFRIRVGIWSTAGQRLDLGLRSPVVLHFRFQFVRKFPNFGVLLQFRLRQRVRVIVADLFAQFLRELDQFC